LGILSLLSAGRAARTLFEPSSPREDGLEKFTDCNFSGSDWGVRALLLAARVTICDLDLGTPFLKSESRLLRRATAPMEVADGSDLRECGDTPRHDSLPCDRKLLLPARVEGGVGIAVRGLVSLDDRTEAAGGVAG